MAGVWTGEEMGMERGIWRGYGVGNGEGYGGGNGDRNMERNMEIEMEIWPEHHCSGTYPGSAGKITPAATAIASQRSFSGCPACPLTQ